MTASRGVNRCPACGQIIRHTHHCRAAGADRAVPMPADFRDRVRLAREAARRDGAAGPETEPVEPPLFDDDGLAS